MGITRAQRRFIRRNAFVTSVRFNAFLLLVLCAAIALCWAALTEPSTTWLNWYLTIAWSLYLPAALVGTLRICAKGDSLFTRSRYAGKTKKLVVFVIPSVARHDTYPALVRVINSICSCAPRNLRAWRVDVVIDEGAEAQDELCSFVTGKPHVRILIVPRSYATPSKTRNKARANHYAAEVRQREGDAREDAYIYHLDDDTHVGNDTIASIAEFIETKAGYYLLAQGVLTFPHELSPSLFCSMADSIRPADDITRCGVFTGDLGSPLAGLHGEHMLVRASAEDKIGWDFGDTLVEDAHFGLAFARAYPGRSCVLNSFSYGASPSRISDLVRQRTRWAAGLIGLVLGENDHPIALRIPIAYTLLCWLLLPFYFVGTVLVVSYASGIDNTSPVVSWAILPWAFTFAYSIWQYIEGARINTIASCVPGSFYLRAIMMVPYLYLFGIIEGYAGICGLFKYIARDRRFEVIKKRT